LNAKQLLYIKEEIRFLEKLNETFNYGTPVEKINYFLKYFIFLTPKDYYIKFMKLPPDQRHLTVQ
jgi:hypothetical protein